jgi:hypothetical protein
MFTQHQQPVMTPPCSIRNGAPQRVWQADYKVDDSRGA